MPGLIQILEKQTKMNFEMNLQVIGVSWKQLWYGYYMDDIRIAFNARESVKLIDAIWTWCEHIVFGTDECLRIYCVLKGHVSRSNLTAGTSEMNVWRCRCSSFANFDLIEEKEY